MAEPAARTRNLKLRGIPVQWLQMQWLGNAAVIASGAVSHLGGAIAEQIKRIDRCLYKAGHQICLSAKDESL